MLCWVTQCEHEAFSQLLSGIFLLYTIINLLWNRTWSSQINNVWVASTYSAITQLFSGIFLWYPALSDLMAGLFVNPLPFSMSVITWLFGVDTFRLIFFYFCIIFCTTPWSLLLIWRGRPIRSSVLLVITLAYRAFLILDLPVWWS